MPVELEGQAKRREDRRCAMIEAARRLFVEQGFDGTNLSQVVQRSGGSLATLYALFSNKEGLLQAVIENDPDSAVTIIERFRPYSDDPAVMLRELGRALHLRFMKPDMLSMLRIIMGQSLRDPEFARLFYDRIGRPTVMRLADLFRRWIDEDRMPPDDPFTLAETFFGLMVHDSQMRMVFGGIETPALGDEALERRLAFFMRGAGIA